MTDSPDEALVFLAAPPGGKGESHSALAEEMLGILTEIARSASMRPRGQQTAVSACRAILEHVRAHTPEFDFIVAAGGPAKAARWIAENRGRLEALLAGKSNVGHHKSIEAPFIAPEDLDHGDASQAEQGPEEQGHARSTQGR